MIEQKNATKKDVMRSLAYLELVAQDNSENEKFVEAVTNVSNRLLSLEAALASVRDWVNEKIE